MRKIKVIIKRPDEPAGHMTWISDTLKNIKKTVEGRIETVTLKNTEPRLVMITNAEGKLNGLDPNFWMGSAAAGDMIVGTVIICGAEGDVFSDIPISMQTWKHLLVEWGNMA